MYFPKVGTDECLDHSHKVVINLHMVQFNELQFAIDFFMQFDFQASFEVEYSSIQSKMTESEQDISMPIFSIKSFVKSIYPFEEVTDEVA